MATQKPSPILSDTVSPQLCKFIEDGPMKRQILATQTPLYEHAFFVDYGHQPSTCRILLVGLEPNGHTVIQYNVIVTQYNEFIISSLIRDEFRLLKPFI